MKTARLLLLASLLAFCSCEKIDKDCPECIRELAREYAKRPICDSGASVGQMLFQGEYVYVFYEGSCGADMASSVINQNCEFLGNLGGFAGNTKINGIEFSVNAVFQKYIWKQE
jgi:hypothetical protein